MDISDEMLMAIHNRYRLWTLASVLNAVFLTPAKQLTMPIPRRQLPHLPSPHVQRRSVSQGIYQDHLSLMMPAVQEDAKLPPQSRKGAVRLLTNCQGRLRIPLENLSELTPLQFHCKRHTVCIERCARKSGGSTAVCLAIGASEHR